MNKEVKKLRKLLGEDERIAVYSISTAYCPFYCIVPSDKDLDRIDLGGCLEDTFHRILDELGIDELFQIMGAELPSDEEMEELEETEEYVPLDLGYVIPGVLLSIEAVA